MHKVLMIYAVDLYCITLSKSTEVPKIVLTALVVWSGLKSLKLFWRGILYVTMMRCLPAR